MSPRALAVFCYIFMIVLLGAVALPARADVLLGPFQPNTGNWNTVPQGDFEFGPEAIRSATDYSASETMFLLVSAGSTGSASTAPSAAQIGSLGGVIQPQDFTGPGIALTYDGVFQVKRGESYVLSAFVKRPTPEGSEANVYLDLWDVPNDLTLKAFKTERWQFIWGTYTAPFDTQVSARAVVDFNVNRRDIVYVDSLALTPAGEF